MFYQKTTTPTNLHSILCIESIGYSQWKIQTKMKEPERLTSAFSRKKHLKRLYSHNDSGFSEHTQHAM